MKTEGVSSEDSSLKVVGFERTPVMSTYLIAFVVGEFDYVEDVDADGVKVRVYTPLEKKEQGRHALEVNYFCVNVAKKSLSFHSGHHTFMQRVLGCSILFQTILHVLMKLWNK